MQVITNTIGFIDIDAYGSMVALAELLRLQGQEAIAASSVSPNASVPPMLRALDAGFRNDYQPTADDTYIVVDASDPEKFDEMVRLHKVTAVIDHHIHLDVDWDKQKHIEVQIEQIGAAATLIFERWRDAGILENMSKESAVLLASGILDNTLNLRAAITIERDKTAYAWLAKHAGLDADWPETYFTLCQEAALKDVRQAIIDDSKVLQYPSLPQKVYVGQLALWNAQAFMQNSKDIVRAALQVKNLSWYMNLIDIHSGRSVFYCTDAGLKEWITQALDVTFKEDLATADRMWLRKEIMQRVIERGETK